MTDAGINAMALIWLVITEMFAVASCVENPNFYSLATVVYLMLFIAFVIVSVVEVRKE